MRRTAFTMIEMLLVLGIAGVLMSFLIPMYRNYQITNELEVTVDSVVQGLHRAQLRSQVGDDDTSWGFFIAEGLLYKGQFHGEHDPTFDEPYGIPPSIVTSGLADVSFARLTGIPSSTGTIILTALNGQQRFIHIVGEPESIVYESPDRLTVCHRPPNNPEAAHTISIPDNAWPAHQEHGDTIGACPQ